MVAELTQWAPGISLTWALASLGLAVLILIVVAVRLINDYRQTDDEE